MALQDERTPLPASSVRGRVDDVRRVAVLRGGGLGDLVFALPALDALRAAYPDADVSLVGPAWQEELLRGRPGPVDRFIALPPAVEASLRGQAGDGVATSVDRFVAALAARRFDLAVQLHGGGRNSNPFVRRIGARVAVGLRSEDAPPLDRVVPYVYYQPEVLRALEVVGLVGAEPVALEPRLVLTVRDLRAGRALLPVADRPLVVVHPGAGDPRRRWPAEAFAAVARQLADEGATIAAVGGPGDRELAAVLRAELGERLVDLVGRCRLGELVGVLGLANVVIGNDSGPSHLAAALGARTVVVYWCGNLINAGPSTRTRHRPAISWRLDCPVCGLDCTRTACAHRASFVADVPVEEVLASARALLGDEPAGSTVGKPAMPEMIEPLVPTFAQPVEAEVVAPMGRTGDADAGRRAEPVATDRQGTGEPAIRG